MGKVSTMEFAAANPDHEKPFPIPRNPWDLATWPGGSSSGTGRWVYAILFNSLGRYEQAFAAARQASAEAPQFYLSAWAPPELIEASTRTGTQRLARAPSINLPRWWWRQTPTGPSESKPAVAPY